MSRPRGATFDFGQSPWARAALLREDRDRAVELAHRATELGVRLTMVGKTERGPWVVYVSDGHQRPRFAGYSPLVDVVAFALERWAAGADDTGIRWLAEADGLAHGQPERGRAVWTLCHRPAVDERLRHPSRATCAACWRALDRDVRAAARGAA